MAHAQIFKGGTPDIRYGRGEGDPTLYGPPFGRDSFGPFSNGPYMNQPPFDAHINGAAGRVSYALGCELAPSRIGWQLDNLKAAKPTVDEAIDMILVPVNHYIEYLRFDVIGYDPRMAGATVTFTGARYTVNPADFNDFIRTEDPFFVNAATAQGITAIPLDDPSSTFISVMTLQNADIQGTAPGGGGAITITSADGYVLPYYVPPEFTGATAAERRRHQTGGLLLGIKILTEPSDTNVRVWDCRHDFYLTTRASGFESPAMT